MSQTELERKLCSAMWEAGLRYFFQRTRLVGREYDKRPNAQESVTASTDV